MISACNRVIVLRTVFDSGSTSAADAAASPLVKLTDLLSFLRVSARLNGSFNSFANAEVIELPPIGTLRVKILSCSTNIRLVVRAPISIRSEQPSNSL